MTNRCCSSAAESGQPHSPLAHSSVSPCSEPRVSQFIKKYVASCLLISDTNTELSYILPSEAVKKGCFERLFQVPTGAGGVGSRRSRGATALRVPPALLTQRFAPTALGAEPGGAGPHQFWTDGHHAGGSLPEGVRGGPVSGEQRRGYGWRGGHRVLLGLARGCVPLRGLGGSSPLACGHRSLLSQGKESSPVEPIPAKGCWPLLCSGFAEQIRPHSVPHQGEGWHGQWQPSFSFQT